MRRAFSGGGLVVLAVLAGCGGGGDSSNQVYLVSKAKIAVGDYPYALAAGHLDVGDVLARDFEKVVVANRDSRDLSLLIYSDVGLSPRWTEQRLDPHLTPYSVAIADLNRDGHPDIVASGVPDDAPGAVVVLIATAPDQFEANSVPTGDGPISLVVADFNGDDAPDIAAANELSADVSVRLGDGHGGLAVEQRFAACEFPRDLAVADVNGDGILDLVAVGGFHDLAILIGAGDGRFARREVLRMGNVPFSVKIVDLNSDQVPDLLVGNDGAPHISIRFGRQTGGFGPERRLGNGKAPRAVAVADVNLDGFEDVIAADFGGSDLAVFTQSGHNRFTPRRQIEVGTHPRSVIVSDIDRDGAEDVVTANSESDDVSILTVLPPF